VSRGQDALAGGGSAVGEGVARARGPFGRSISRQDADTLELLAEVLDLSDADPHRLFAFI
jgi:hypothetical protein